MAMAAQVRDFPVVSGGDKKLTLGDLIDWTPKENISKAMQEEKVFKTWYGLRTVLIGDGKIYKCTSKVDFCKEKATWLIFFFLLTF